MNNLRRWILLLAVGPAALQADSATDRKIEHTAESSYNFRSVLANEVKANAEDGVVTLTGTVLDRDQKALAEDTVRSLPGVVDVLNHLDVSEPGQERSDGWIALKIRSILLLRPTVSATNTDVAVRDGVVVLRGTADDFTQKELTESYARNVQGVRSVRNEMNVRAVEEASPTARAQPAVEKIDDNSITAQVKYALLGDDSDAALATRIETLDGTVVIRGTARSEAQKERISQLARGVRGVNTVNNEMIVSAAE